VHPVLEGRDVVLRRPIPARDTPALYLATHGAPDREEVWTYLGYGPWPDEAAMQGWMVGTIDSLDPYWYGIEAGGHPIGMAAVMSRDALHRRAEIGHIWYAPDAQRTTANTEAAYLMVRECFETLSCRRVEWKCDALNARSRAAALRLGFTFEGVFRNHMIVKGRNRDTAWYAITDAEWPAVRAALESWLYEVPRDATGRPQRSLAELR
jgi:RimJ/RimL family protein N-acetyltransferase